MIDLANVSLGAHHVPLPAAVPFLGERVRLSGAAQLRDVDWTARYLPNGDPLGNDTLGCCVEAATLQELYWRMAVAQGDVRRPTRQMVVDRYTAITGYNPTTGEGDNGTDTAAETLDYCTRGIEISDQTLDIPHVVKLQVSDLRQMTQAMEWFGPFPMTLRLPMALQDLSAWGKPPAPGDDWGTAWGLHRVLTGKLVGSMFCVLTWGEEVAVHPDVMGRILIAAECRISRMWVEASGATPSGLDWDRLMADRAALADV